MSDAEELVQQAIKALDSGNTAQALRHFEEALEAGSDETPLVECGYAVCLAAERQEYERAIALCQGAIDKEPGKSVHYLNLGRIYVHAGRKKDAIRMFRDGLLFEKNPRISEELNRLGWRDVPVIQSLGREHILNRILGKVYSALGLR